MPIACAFVTVTLLTIPVLVRCWLNLLQITAICPQHVKPILTTPSQLLCSFAFVWPQLFKNSGSYPKAINNIINNIDLFQALFPIGSTVPCTEMDQEGLSLEIPSLTTGLMEWRCCIGSRLRMER